MIRIVFMAWGLMVMMSARSLESKSVFTNALIYDGENFLSENTFIIENGRFLKIGTFGDLKSSISKDDEIIDLHGARVIPGFIESHGHLLGLGQSVLNLDVRNLQPEKINQAVAEQAKKQAPGTWIRGRGWDQNLWASKNFPTAAMLSAAKDHPVYLRRVDGHAAWLNDYALRILEINAKTPNPEGGIIQKDKDGNPTGVLIDNAMALARKFVDAYSTQERSHFLEVGMNKALSLGVTSFHDAGSSREALELFTEQANKNNLKMRIYAMVDGEDNALVASYFKKGPQKISDFLSIRSIKYFADGALGSRGALLLNDYRDQAGNQGLSLMSEKALEEKTLSALNAGFQVATHAIGDKANRLVLNAYERALKKNPVYDRRLRVEHAQLVDPGDHHRFKELSVIASMQPIHCTSDMAWVPSRIGADRLFERAYPWRSLQLAGAVLAFGSDTPVESINPIEGLYAAVSRMNLSSRIPFMPEQQLTMKEALRGYFLGAAFAEFNEHQKGKIARGFLADFVAYQDDILHARKETFLKALPMMTVVGGKIVYKNIK